MIRGLNRAWKFELKCKNYEEAQENEARSLKRINFQGLALRLQIPTIQHRTFKTFYEISFWKKKMITFKFFWLPLISIENVWLKICIMFIVNELCKIPEVIIINITHPLFWEIKLLYRCVPQSKIWKHQRRNASAFERY